jgi:hypothetical protein
MESIDFLFFAILPMLSVGLGFVVVWLAWKNKKLQGQVFLYQDLYNRASSESIQQATELADLRHQIQINQKRNKKWAVEIGGHIVDVVWPASVGGVRIVTR